MIRLISSAIAMISQPRAASTDGIAVITIQAITKATTTESGEVNMSHRVSQHSSFNANCDSYRRREYRDLLPTKQSGRAKFCNLSANRCR